ncbi:FtsX-like permease family protein [Bacteroides heparinolyticus]|uniref:FtsX-like permease family protein n=1 Tax=Prevotella heparinolytica TaxID=28113 RepID=UPI0023F61B6B|nr:FtsX-like permease family protein [Bacteroides heparinolyticus]MCI6212723.1 ABC transporter permease [Bacteroides heparinolyticus]
MIKSLFSQIWNRRRSNAWIGAELLVVLVLLWYGIDLIYNYEAAARRPKGYDTENVFHVQLTIEPMLSRDSAMMSRSAEYLEQIYGLISRYPGVESACYYWGTIPYTEQVMFEGYAPHTDSTHVVHCNIRYVSPDYFDVFRLKPLRGTFDAAHWLKDEYPMPVMMSVALSDSLFSGRSGVGETCFNPYYMQSARPETNYKVMAVLPAHKTDEYERYQPFIYLPATASLPGHWAGIAVRVSSGSVAGFAERFTTDMQGRLAIGPYHLYDIRSYADMKEAFDIEKGTVNYLNTTYAVILFFAFNVFLGVLGTFWFRTRKRRSEIALRMAMGCSRPRVFGYYVMEGMLLLALAAFPALIICVNMQAADLTVHTLMDVTPGRFFLCFAAAVLLLAVIIMLGICFPARKAMRIQPAEALHDE